MMKHLQLTRVVSAYVTAVRTLTLRGMRCVDATVRNFVSVYLDNIEPFLDNEAFGNVCLIFARYIMLDETVPSLMSEIAVGIRPLLFLSDSTKRRHTSIDYDACYLAFCADDTAALAKDVVRISTELSEKCDIIAKARRVDPETVSGRIFFVHAHEKNFENTPSVAKANAMRDKHVAKRISIEMFYAAELQFDRTIHESVPKHTALDQLTLDNDEMREELRRDKDKGYAKAQKEPQNLPKLKADDIIVRLLGMTCGQIVRVESTDIALGGTIFEYLQII